MDMHRRIYTGLQCHTCTFNVLDCMWFLDSSCSVTYSLFTHIHICGEQTDAGIVQILEFVFKRREFSTTLDLVNA